MGWPELGAHGDYQIEKFLYVYQHVKEFLRSNSVYKVDVSGNPGRGSPIRTYIDLIGEVLQKGQVRSTRNRRACMIRCMNVDEARGVSKDL